jgi:hypothetical protein
VAVGIPRRRVTQYLRSRESESARLKPLLTYERAAAKVAALKRFWYNI